MQSARLESLICVPFLCSECPLVSLIILALSVSHHLTLSSAKGAVDEDNQCLCLGRLGARCFDLAVPFSPVIVLCM